MAKGMTSNRTMVRHISAAVSELRPRQRATRRSRAGEIVVQMTTASNRVPVKGSRTATQPIRRIATMAIWMSCLCASENWCVMTWRGV